VLELDAAAEELLLASDKDEELADEVIAPVSTLTGSEDDVLLGKSYPFGDVKLPGRVKLSGSVKLAGSVELLGRVKLLGRS
jgi:hypothetical protein